MPEFTARFGPSQEDYDALIAFAKASGFTVTGGSRDSMDVQFTASVASIEQGLPCDHGLYQHPTENRTFFALDREPTGRSAVPALARHGFGQLSDPAARARVEENRGRTEAQATTGSCPEASFCGSDMRAAYYGGTALTGAGQNIGLLEYAGFDIADVNTYYKNAGQTRTFAVDWHFHRRHQRQLPRSQGCDDTEQTIDITQAVGMAPGVTTVYLYVGSHRYRAFGRHVYAISAAVELELFVDLGLRRPQH